MKKSNIGRPTVMTPETINKLEEAFLLGCSDLEACFSANISSQTLYDYQKRCPEFIERKKLLKENPIYVARKSVVDDLRGNPELALKYLERKKKDEFSLKTESANTNNNSNSIVYIEKEEKESINKAINDIVNGD